MRAVGFYPAKENELLEQIEKCLSSDQLISDSKGLILPHAGYPFSGSVLGKALDSVEIDEKNITIFGPSHYSSDTFLDEGDWKTPLGEVKTNLDFDLKKHTSRDHSIEVIVPFLQYKLKEFSLTPLVMGENSFDDLKELAEKFFSKDSFFIASSDFFHYGPDFGYDPVQGSMDDKLKWVKERDDELKDMICNLKARDFFDTVKDNNYTVCGFRPITLLLLIMQKLNVGGGKRVDYKTSYEVKKGSSFVSYQGIVFV